MSSGPFSRTTTCGAGDLALTPFGGHRTRENVHQTGSRPAWATFMPGTDSQRQRPGRHRDATDTAQWVHRQRPEESKE